MYKYIVQDICKRSEVLLAINDNTTELQMQIGNLHIFRDLEYKGKFFAPYVPTTDLLFLFPSSSSASDRANFAPRALEKITNYLNYLFLNSRETKWHVIDGGLCLTSGHAFVTIRCGGIIQALQVQSVWGAVELQDETMRMSSLYIQCYPCVASEANLSSYHSHNSLWKAEEMQNYYAIPTCILCADRLETVLTGEASDSPLCTCAREGQRCSCVQNSRCVVCKLFLQAQETNNMICNDKISMTNRNTNNNNNSSTDNNGDMRCSMPHISCQECGQAGDPWVCLICGYVGCSRYQAMHAKEHCLTHKHYFSMNLLTQQIWDYHSDAFVHRVVMHVDVAAGNAARVEYPSRDTPQLEAVYSAADNILGSTQLDNNSNSNNSNPYLSSHNENNVSESNTNNNIGNRNNYTLINSSNTTLLSEPYKANKPMHSLLSCNVSNSNNSVLSSGCICEEVHCGFTASKKSVSAKYDTKLSTSHTQYAMLIKNELDTLRLSFEAAMRESNKNKNLHVANVNMNDSNNNENDKSLEKSNTITEKHLYRWQKPSEQLLSELEQQQEHQQQLENEQEYWQEEQWQEQEQEEEEKQVKVNCHDTGDSKCHDKNVRRKAIQKEEKAKFCDVFNAFSDLEIHRSKLNHDVACLSYTLRNLNDERQLSDRQNKALTIEKETLHSQIKACISANTQAALTLQTSINDLESMIEDINANVRTNAELTRRLGNNDAIGQIAILGSSTQTKGKLKITSKKK